MAITNLNPTYLGTGPTVSGQVIFAGPSDVQEFAYKGSWTVTLDGSATSAVVNWIDGTATLPFTPSIVLTGVTGGNQGAAAVVDVVVDTITNTGCTLRLSGAGTSAKTLQVGFLAMK